MQKILLPLLLLGASPLALAAPDAKPKVPAKPSSLEKINAGELRLDGKITAILGTGLWQLDAISWTSPRGVTTEFDDVKSKSVQLSPSAIIHPLGQTKKVALGEVKLKSTVAVIGKNGPDGTVMVREVILLEGYGDIKTVGTLESNPYSIKLINQSRTARAAGQLQKALDLARKAAETAAGMGDESGEALASQDIAILYLELKQPQQALDSFKRGQTLGERIGNPLAQVLGLEGQAGIIGASGQTDEAATLYERAFRLAQQTPISLQVGVLNGLFSLYARAGKDADAAAALVRLFPLEEASGKPDDATRSLLTLAQLQAPTDAVAAKKYLDMATPRLSNIREGAARLDLTLRYAIALRATGDTPGAREQFGTVAQLADAKGNIKTAEYARAQIKKLAEGNTAPADVPPTPADAPPAPADNPPPATDNPPDAPPDQG